MAAEYRFYTYAICDESENIIYIGKGSGKRIKASLKLRGGSSAYEVARLLLGYYNAYKLLASKIDYCQSLRDALEGLDITRLREVGYGCE